MIETQQSIHAWSLETFGQCDDLGLFAARINEEMAELVRVCCGNRDPGIFGEDVRAEFADAVANMAADALDDGAHPGAVLSAAAIAVCFIAEKTNQNSACADILERWAADLRSGIPIFDERGGQA